MFFVTDTKRTNSNVKGFTLIELLVASSIFIMVVTVAVGMFVSASRAQRKVIAIQEVENDARFIMEFIVKEVRVSEISPPGGTGLQSMQITRNVDGDDVIYAFVGGNITRDNLNDAQAALAINGANVAVSGSFDIRGTGADDGQPMVTIVLDVSKAGQVGESADVHLQTTVVERAPDNDH